MDFLGVGQPVYPVSGKFASERYERNKKLDEISSKLRLLNDQNEIADNLDDPFKTKKREPVQIDS